jgi:TonB family protein
MRKTTFVKPLSCCIDLICLVAFGLVCLPAFAQASGSAAAPAKDAPTATMPTDPKALMLLAARTNGLTGPDVQPWHLKFTFDVPGSDFAASDHGTIEEWWSSDTRYKIAIASTHFEQTEYGTDSGIRRSGVRSSAPSLIASIKDDVLLPIPLSSKQLDNLKIELHAQKMGDATFSCLAVGGSAPTADADAIKPSTYCLDATQPVLRIRYSPGSGNTQIYSHIVRFQGRFVARQIEHDFFDFQGKNSVTLWKMQIDLLETLKPADEKDLDPPAGTLPAAKTVTVSEKDARALLLDHPKPVYPPIAKAAHVSGSVVLRATVGTDGRVRSLSVISGPAMLQQASLNAVKQWTFKQYMVDGDPAEMETTITVPFSFLPGFDSVL